MFVDRSRDRRKFLLATLVVGLLLVPVGMATAQDYDDPETLRSAVEESFEVLPARDGVFLRPLEESSFDTLEIGEGRLYLDGRPVTAAELSARIGREDTRLVRNLLRLEPRELKVLFGFSPEGAEAEVRVESETTVAPEPPEAPEVEELRDRLGELREEQARRARKEAEEQARVAREIEEEQRRIQEEIREELKEKIRELDEESRDRRRRHRSDARVVFGSPVTVEKDEITGDVVSIGGPVTVDGEVDGDAVAIGGPVRIQGQVQGDVVSVGGGVRLYSEARVDGDVVSVGGKLIREPGAQVDGEITEVSLWQGMFVPGFEGWSWRGRDRYDFFDGALSDLVGGLIRLAVLVLLGLVGLTVARERFEAMAAHAAAEPWRDGLIGFLSLIFFVPLLVIVVIVLCISILGIPLLLLVPFAILAFVILAFIGYLAVGYQMGRWLERRVERPGIAPFGALLVGLILIHGWNVLGDLIDLLDTAHDFAWPLVLLLGLFGFVVKLSAWSVGLGSAITTRVGGRGPGGEPTAAGSPPPPPPTEPAGEPGQEDLPYEPRHEAGWDDLETSGPAREDEAWLASSEDSEQEGWDEAPEPPELSADSETRETTEPEEEDDDQR
ncbi:MAG: hypothetical protein R3234_02610 [Thermoanaerobaculia bacterium]|nr:hypothetical protein [Thermoanaerobaculia bacterium]